MANASSFANCLLYFQVETFLKDLKRKQEKSAEDKHIKAFLVFDYKIMKCQSVTSLFKNGRVNNRKQLIPSGYTDERHACSRVNICLCVCFFFTFKHTTVCTHYINDDLITLKTEHK